MLGDLVLLFVDWWREWRQGERNSAVNALLDRIRIDQRVCGGKPCIKGTRIWVSRIRDPLADGMTEAELLAEYPQTRA